jgi:hypothetical protein
LRRSVHMKIFIEISSASQPDYAMPFRMNLYGQFNTNTFPVSS